MESESEQPVDTVVKWCDCGCDCCSAKLDESGIWSRSVKRKFDEGDDENVVFIPGLSDADVARVDLGNECMALREMVNRQQETIQDLSIELEEERNAASSAANETMSMILRLQSEKAELQMEARQFKRFSEEKMAHDQEEIMALEDLLYQKEQTIEALTCEINAYKHRMMSYGITGSEADGENNIGIHFELPTYNYPPLKCNLAENHADRDLDGEIVDIEKHAFDESPNSLKAIEERISELEGVPSHSPVKEVIFSDSPKKLSSDNGEELVDNASEFGDDMTDRICTVDSVYNVTSSDKNQKVNDAVNVTQNIGDSEVKNLYARLHALEADRESMKQALMSMRTEKAQLVLLKEIAQHLYKDMPARNRMPVKKQSIFGNFSFVLLFKWVFSFLFWRSASRSKLKTDEHGKINRYKARLVAKGFHQQHGVDYHETFSPVIKPATIRTVLSLAVANKWTLKQLDIQTAFLHGDLEETVYMRQPPGFVDPTKPHHVCHLNKSLYGLKQAPRAWFNKLTLALHQLGFHGSKTDPSLFILQSAGSLVYLLVYVDDIIITGNNSTIVSGIIQQLNSVFALKDMGQLHYFLGVEVVHRDSDLILSQRKYISEVLHKAGLADCKPVTTPMSTSSILLPDDSPLLEDPSKYRQTVGALQYVTLSRPDIAFAVNKVCQFMHAPTENHWAAVKRILRYLKGTINLGLWIRHNTGHQLQAFADSHWSTHLKAFSDSDWAGCPIDRRSTGGFAIYLGTNLISWSARKQKTVSRSSTESEYKAIADTVAELIWLKSLLHELGLKSEAPTLWCDNLGATYLSANPVFRARTKHVEVDYHFVREQVSQGKLNIKFISTDDQIADIFTKPLSSQKFEFLRSKLQIANRPELAGKY